MVNTEFRHLPVYIRRIKVLAKFNAVIKDFHTIVADSPYTIEDLSEVSDRDKYARINNAIYVRRKHLYKVDEKDPVYLSIFRVAKDDYILVVSLDPSNMIGKKVLKTCFETVSAEPIFCINPRHEAPFICSRHFQKMLPKHGVEPACDYNTDMHRVNGVRAQETFYLPMALQDTINQKMISPESTIQGLIVLIWGFIMCSYVGRKKIITRVVHEGGILRSFPMVIDIEQVFNEQHDRIKDEFRKAEDYDRCSVGVLNSQLHYDFAKYAPLSYEFFHNHMYDYFLRAIRDGITYVSEEYEDTLTPISVKCEYIDGKFTFIYDYDEGYFQGMQIACLHDKMIEFLKKSFQS